MEKNVHVTKTQAKVQAEISFIFPNCESCFHKYKTIGKRLL